MELEEIESNFPENHHDLVILSLLTYGKLCDTSIPFSPIPSLEKSCEKDDKRLVWPASYLNTIEFASTDCSDIVALSQQPFRQLPCHRTKYQT